jgi:DNA-binding GntR family transcriptional regulator
VARHRAGSKPKYQQIVDAIRAKISDGTYPVGAQIPIKPELMSQYAAAVGTVDHALKVLREAGLVVSYQGVGTFVRARPGDERLPDDEWRERIEKRVDELEAYVMDLRANAGLDQPGTSGTISEAR